MTGCVRSARDSDDAMVVFLNNLLKIISTVLCKWLFILNIVQGKNNVCCACEWREGDQNSMPHGNGLWYGYKKIILWRCCSSGSLILVSVTVPL